MNEWAHKREGTGSVKASSSVISLPVPADSATPKKELQISAAAVTTVWFLKGNVSKSTTCEGVFLVFGWTNCPEPIRVTPPCLPPPGGRRPSKVWTVSLQPLRFLFISTQMDSGCAWPPLEQMLDKLCDWPTSQSQSTCQCALLILKKQLNCLHNHTTNTTKHLSPFSVFILQFEYIFIRGVPQGCVLSPFNLYTV